MLFKAGFLFAENYNFLIYSTKIYGESSQKDLLKLYLEKLKEQLSKEGIQFKEEPLSSKEAQTLLKSGAYKGIAEFKAILIGDEVSFEWKLILSNRSKPYYFYVSGKKDELFQQVQKTTNILASILGKKKIIEEVRVSGNLRIGEDSIFLKISTKPGDILDYKKLDEDLKAIYRMGYFENVEVKLDKGTRGVIVTFEVKESPSVKEIVFKGNKEVKSDDLLKIVNIEEDSIVTPKELDKAIENIKDYYEQLGYTETEVTISSKKVSPTQIKLIFNIKEGKKKYIKKIEFIGNKAFSDKQLKKLLSISEKTRFSLLKKFWKYFKALFKPEPIVEPGVYNVIFLYRDLGRIETFYKNHGYIDAKVGEPIVKEEKKKKKVWVTIKIPIEEGPQYRIGKVKVEQDLFPEDKIYKKLQCKPGKIISLQTLREDESILTHLFSDYGYAYAKVDTEIKKDPKKRLVDINFKVNKGPVVYIRRIEIVGNTKTRDKVIRRQIRLAEGWPYSARRLEESEMYLRRLGFFEKVEIQKEKAAKENELNLKVKVKEMLTGSFAVGGGYSSYDKFVMMVDVTERNFLGKGQRVNISARLGARSNRYSLNFFDPYFRDTPYSFGWSLYNYEIQYTDFTKNSKGGSIKIGYNFSSKVYGYIRYRYDDTKLKDLGENVSKVILESKDINITSAFQIGGDYDSRNRFFLPTKGWYHSIDIEYAQSLFGGESHYVKIDGLHHLYVPLISTKVIGHLKLGYGYITEGKDYKIPVYERYFLGGINSVRGYEYGYISPIDPETGEKIGGTRMAYFQAETIFPLVKDIQLAGVIFFDIGTAWDKNTGFKTSELKKSVGFGIRWFSPLGPIRMEWGFNIDRKPGEDASNFNFQIGAFF